MKWFLVSVFALAGCAGQAEPEPRTVRVEVPVAVPCRAPEVQEPTWATASLQKGDSLQTKVRALRPNWNSGMATRCNWSRQFRPAGRV